VALPHSLTFSAATIRVAFLGTYEAFLMPYLEEDGPNDVDLLFQQDGGHPH